MVWVTVAGKHVDSHSMDLTDVHSSGILQKGFEQMFRAGNECCICLKVTEVNLLAINSCYNLAVDVLLSQRPQHALTTVGPPLQVDYKHLLKHKKHTEYNVKKRTIPMSTINRHVYLIKVHFVRSFDRFGQVSGRLNWRISHWKLKEVVTFDKA